MSIIYNEQEDRYIDTDQEDMEVQAMIDLGLTEDEAERMLEDNN
jgi:hypothetical protein